MGTDDRGLMSDDRQSRLSSEDAQSQSKDRPDEEVRNATEEGGSESSRSEQ